MNNKSTDQSAHLHSLINIFVNSLLESIISELATREISIVLASLCSWGDWFQSYFVGNPEDRCYHVQAHMWAAPDRFGFSRLYRPCCEKTCLLGFTNNTGADQSAHPHILISAIVLRLLESIISRLATSKISIFKLVSVAEQAGLNLTLAEIPKTGFVMSRPICGLLLIHFPDYKNI